MGKRAITIIGGGLAGLAAGIGLRRAGVAARICEAGEYPRHKVCGEFISGRGAALLRHWGLLDKLNVVAARTAAFYNPSGPLLHARLPAPGLGVSRYELDAVLAAEFLREGGELLIKRRWRGDWREPGLVRATGRRLQIRAEGIRWVGLKAHFSDAALQADLEMHFDEHGYVGLSKLPGGKINVCGLFQADAQARVGAAPQPHSAWNWLRGPSGGPRERKLRGAKLKEESVCSVAGLPVGQWERPADEDGCCLGDAFAMIPPVTGNGMSLALESAECALPALIEFGRGKLSWSEAREEIGQRCQSRFGRRLRWANWLHRILFRPTARPWLFRVGGCRLVFGKLFWATRQ